MKRLLIVFLLTYTMFLGGCTSSEGSQSSSRSFLDSSVYDIGGSSYDENTVTDGTDSSGLGGLTFTDSEVSDEPVSEAPTVKEFLSAALEPCGRCLYVWSGGWNEEDTAAGVDAMTYGVSSRWYEFFKENGSDYDSAETAFQIHDGLDCTGYLGWSLYQVFGDSYSDSGYVFQSGMVIDNYISLFGGEKTQASEVVDYAAGDIMCRDGHVFIVIGQCDDGSLLFLHASPPAVSICATVTPSGDENSEAIVLAEEYMEKYRNECYEKFDTCRRGTSYLTQYDRYRFDTSVLSGQDYYEGMSPREILEDLFSE